MGETIYHNLDGAYTEVKPALEPHHSEAGTVTTNKYSSTMGNLPQTVKFGAQSSIKINDTIAASVGSIVLVYANLGFIFDDT